MKNLTLFLFILSETCFSLSLKTHREYYESLLVLLHVSPDETMERTYLLVRPLLSQSGRTSDYSSGMQIGLLRLAGLVCKDRIEKDAGEKIPQKRWMNKGFDFALQPAQVPLSTWKGIVEEYAFVLWQRKSTPEETDLLLDWLQAATRKTFLEAEQNIPKLESLCAFMAISPAVLVR